MATGSRRRLFLAVAMASVVCFGVIGSVYAEPFPLEPYISITIPDGLDFGSIPYPGNHVFTPQLTAHITANCPHHAEVSLQPFVREGGGSIPLDRSTVALLNPISSPVGTPPGGADATFNLRFDIETKFEDKPGAYSGSLVITVMAGP